MITTIVEPKLFYFGLQIRNHDGDIMIDIGLYLIRIVTILCVQTI